MARFTNSLNYVRVAAPCTADWNKMVGNEQVRFCDQCSLNVYNLSGMSQQKAETLIANAEGRLCVQFYRRADGAILTQNCPVGLRAIKRWATRAASLMLSSVLSFVAGLCAYGGLMKTEALILSAIEEPVQLVESSPKLMEFKMEIPAPENAVANVSLIRGQITLPVEET